MTMQIKASVAALMLAFAGTAAWADTSDPEQNTAGPSTLDPAGAAQAPTGWQYMNGEPAAEGGQSSAAASSQSDADEQAKTSLGFTEGDQEGSDQAAQAEDSDKMAGTDQPKGEEASAASGDSENDDTAMSDEEADRFEAAKPDEEGQAGQAATSGESGDENQAATSDGSATSSSQAAGSDDSAGDQYTAEQQDGTTQSEGSDQPGMSEDQTGGPASQGEDSADQPAHSPREPDSGQASMSEDPGSDPSAQAQDESSDQAADSGTPAELQGKVVVIIPKDWEGSLEGLLSALQTSPDAKDIVIVQQGQPDDPQASTTDEPDDTFEASRVRPLNQQ
jgi:hypothetical protein